MTPVIKKALLKNYVPTTQVY